MNDKFTRFILRFICAAGLLAGPAFYVFAQDNGGFAGGSGSEADPWIIETLEQLDNLRNYLGNDHSDKFFRQNADIDASETVSWNDGQGWEPVGPSITNSFRGSYNGNGFSIDGLTINRPSEVCVGLFGYISNAEIKDIGLTNVDIKGDYLTGAISALVENSVIKTCYATGSVTGRWYVGGLVGRMLNSGLVQSYNSSNVEGSFHVGGLAGSSNDSYIHNSYNTGKIKATSTTVGGLVGDNRSGIFFSYNTGKIYGPDYEGTRLAGSMEGEVKFSFMEVETPGLESTSPGEEKTAAEMQDFSTFTRANWELKEPGKPGIWNMGNNRNNGYPYLSWQYPDEPPHPEADNDFAGIVNLSSITDITRNSATLTGYVYFPGKPDAIQHGFCWNTSGMPVVEDNNWENGPVSQYGDVFSYSISGLDPAYTYYIRAFIINDAGISYSDEYTIPLHPDGSGTEADPFLISSFNELLWMSVGYPADGFEGKYFLQTSDIDASSSQDLNRGKGWSPIGTAVNHFRGYYDGNGFSIDGLTINRPGEDYTGLFGYTSNAEIKNLGLINIDIKGNDCSGGLAGYASSSTITRCYVTGSVTGSRYTGGLAGRLLASGITESFNSSDVEGTGDVGGLVGEGRDGSAITDCFNTGTVKGGDRTGGIIGEIRQSLISNAYNTGHLSGGWPVGGLVGRAHGSEIKFSFWDLQTSSRWSSDGGGEGKSTEEMKEILTYVSNDWNMKETGKDGIWNMGNDRNDGYPYLAWQYPDDPPHPEADNDFLAIISTTGISDIISTGATLNGSVYFPGKPAATEYGFCWNTSGMPAIDDNRLVKDEIQRGDFSYTVSDLNPDHVHYVRAYAINDAGVVYGEEFKFLLLPSGSGTEEDPYLINSLTNLLWVEEETNNRRLFTDTWFLQTADIDASATINWNDGKGWRPIGRGWNSDFRGIYDGGGHVIDGLYINRPDENYVGLFGDLRNAKISNMGLTNADITGYINVGGISGAIYESKVNKCYTTGSVRGDRSVGGFAGSIYSGSKIEACFNRAVVEGDGRVGGFAGNTSGSDFYDSYNLGAVKGNERIGGFAGESTSRLRNVYNAGEVTGNERTGGLTGDGNKDVHYSFWDLDVSGQQTSYAGYGKTTLEMKDIFTFVTSYYDMKREGIEGVWNIGNGRNDGYPYLDWQYPDDPPHPEADNDYLPVVFTEVIGGIYENSVTLNGYISFEGQPTSGRHGFCWNTAGMPTVDDEVLENGPVAAPGAFSMEVGGLERDKVYYVRAFSVNDAGIEYGTEIEFTTAPGGSGTEDDPYLIENLTHLLWITQETKNGNSFEGQYFLQTKNIDASSTSTWNKGMGWDPAGLFSGNYNGSYHTVNNLYINRPDDLWIGLFGRISSAEISNLGVYADITGQEGVAGIAGMAEMSLIRNCYVTGTIKGSQIVGGITNAVMSQVVSSFNLAEITSELLAGGLTGYLLGSEISNSYNLGVVTGVEFIGGLAGWAMEGSVISNSYNAGKISGDMLSATLTGFAEDVKINFSFWDDEASGIDLNNGGKSLTPSEMKEFSTFFSAGWDMKGLGNEGIWNIGNNRNNGYPYLSWQYPDDPPHPASENDFLPVVETNPATDITGDGAILNARIMLEGKPAATEFGFYWNTTGMPAEGDERSGAVEIADSTFSFEITGLERGPVYYARAFAVNTNGTFYADEVKFVLAPEGSGTEADPYLIATLGDLLWMAWETNEGNDFSGKFFLQTSDIDAKEVSTWDNGRGWQPVGKLGEFSSFPFSGDYDGNGHIIDNLFINTPGVVLGVFGYLRDAEISNVGVTNANISGSYYIGALAGYADRTLIKNCFSTGSVAGSYFVGGLVGTTDRSSSSSSIEFCFSTANVSGVEGVGGLAGYANRVSDSYSTGIVIGSHFVGGLCGEINNWSSTVKNSYSTSIVKAEDSSGGLIGREHSRTIENSWWNTETSGLDHSHGGEGLTTAEMLMEVNFDNWDFSEVWGIREGETYPYLKWQGEAWDHNYPHCSFPSKLDAVEIGSSSATLKWNDDIATSWNVQWGIEGFVPGTGEMARGITETELTISGIAPLTSHDFWVQSDCSRESSYWSGPYTFKTLKGEIVITGATALKGYDGTLEAVIADWGTFEGLHEGHRVSVGNYSARFDDPDAGTDKPLTFSNIEFTGRDIHKYYLRTPGNIKGDIVPRELDVINALVDDKIYDYTAGAVISGAELQGILPGDDVSLENSGLGTFYSTTVGEGISVTTIMTLGGEDAGNYLIVQPELTGNIIPRDLTVTAKTLLKVKGEEYLFTEDDYKVDGLAGSDEVVSVTLTSDGADKGADAGEYAVIPSDATGTGLANYNIKYVNGIMRVAEIREVTISLVRVENRYYDGTVQAVVTEWGPLEGVSEGDDVSLSTVDYKAVFECPGAGTDKEVIISNLKLEGDDAPFYTVGPHTAVADINRAELTVSGSFEVENKIYDGTSAAVISENQLTLEGIVGQDDVELTGIVAEFAQSDAGENILVTLSSAEIAGNDAGNYILSTEVMPSATFVITPRELSVTGSFEVENKVYDGTTTAVISENQLTLEGVVGQDDVGLTGIAAEFAQSDAGEGIQVVLPSALITGADAGNYVLSSEVMPTTLADIARIELNITADDKTRVYGDAEPVFTTVIEGFIDGENESVLDGQLSVDREEGKDIGSYQIIPSGVESGNYQISFVTGTLTITPRELTVSGSFEVEDKVYDGTTAAVIAENLMTLEGVVGQDDVGLTGIAAEFAQSDAGDGIQVTITSASLSGDDAGNYTLSLYGAPASYAGISNITFTLTITTVGEGSVKVNGDVYTGILTFEEGTELDLEALADEGWEFGGWSGDIQSAGATETIVMDADKSISVEFSLITGTGHLTGENVLAYPNPFNDRIFVENISNAKRIALNDISGRTVMLIQPGGSDREVISTGMLTRGIYFLVIDWENGERQVFRMVRD